MNVTSTVPDSSRRQLPVLAVLTLSVAALAGLAAAPASAHTRITTNITWSEDVRAILRQHCMRCHSPGGAAPAFADFTRYGTDSDPGARAWAAAIEEEILTGRMPPWNPDPRYGRFANARTLTQEETDKIVAWVQGGAPQGPRRDLPPPPEFVEFAWELGTPDLVVDPPEVLVLAAGEASATSRASIDLQIAEPMWITGYEFRPDNGNLVERMTAWIVPPEGAEPEELELEVQVPYDPFRDEDEPEPTRMRPLASGRQLLAQWSRGDGPVLLPDGIGRRLPAGSRIELETVLRRRFGAQGEVRDRSRLGLVLAEDGGEEVDLLAEVALSDAAAGVEGAPAKRKRRSRRRGGPAAAAATPLADLRFSEDVRLTAFAPLSMAGLRSLELLVDYPDGRVNTLVRVPEFDSDWPNNLRFAEPLPLPAGGRVRLLGSVDAETAAVTPQFAVEYTLDDHLVLPELPVVRSEAEAPARGGMMIGAGVQGVEGAPPPADSDPLAPEATAADPNAAAHMDHSPVHGGQFFMAANQFHHLEGALPEAGRFRIYVYDDFKKPIDPRNFAGDVIFERYDDESGDFTEESYPLFWPSGADHLAADIPEEFPAEFFASVWLAGDKQRFDFYFEETSKRIIARPTAGPVAVGAEHSHERPPLAIPGTAAGIAGELRTRVTQLEQKIAQGDWLKLYVPAFDGRDLAEALLDQLQAMSPRSVGRVRRAVSRVMQSAAALDRAGDLGDPLRAEQALDRFRSGVEEIAAEVEG